MTTLAKLLETLGALGVKLWVDGEKLAYSAPKGALTPALLQELRSHKEEVLASLRQARPAAAPPPLSPLLSRGPEGSSDPLPLSFGQQSLWFLDQLGSGSAYNLPAAFRIKGPLDTDALARSLTEIVRRHESLRTVFSTESGRARQVIRAPGPVPLPLSDLMPLSAAEQEEALSLTAAAEATHHFDLSQDVMLRAALSRLRPDEHVLFVTLHHIAVDGWSIGIFFQELSALYEAFSKGRPSPLTPLTAQYADFTLWQRSWLGGDLLARQVDWWKQHLTGAPALLALPTDRPRAATQSHRGGSASFRVDEAVTGALRALTRRTGGTLFTTLLAAFDVLLSRHSLQDDIVVGVPVAGRAAPALEPLIGMFNNTLAVRADLSGNPTFLEMAERARVAMREAFERKDAPLSHIVAALEIERSLSYSPLYQATLVLQNSPPSAFTLAGAEVRSERFGVQTTRFDLVLDLTEHEGGLEGVCTYNADIFDTSTIERLLGHFHMLLAGIVADPAARIEQLPMLTPREREELVRWNDTATKAPDRCAHELFSAQARRTPDALAAALLAPCGLEGAPLAPVLSSLTYRELDARSNQLAHHLRSLGVGRGDRVGIYMERSLELVVALLGVLKAGGAYLPLDPSYPAERVDFMRRDASAAVVLSQSHLRSKLPEGARRVVSLDSEWPLLARHSTAEPDRIVEPTNLAYVIFTSGSTGRPKGVMIEHRGLSNYLTFAAREYGAAKGRGALLCSSIGFDLTVTSVFAPLLTGTALFLLPPGDEITALASELRQRRGHSFLKLTPAHLALLAQMLPAEQLAAATPVFVLGGEQLSFEAIAPLREQKGAPRIVNEYGPTEAVVGCCVHEVTPDERGSFAVPIGRPIDNTTIHLLDRHLAQVPVGVTGEIYIGGAQVARGYLNRPELNEERFIADPFDGSGSGRLYRTGDLARRREGGVLEFLGRADRQIKLRGFRIELAEIEESLRQYPGVGSAAVALRVDPRERLVAYFTRDLTRDAGTEVSTDGLRAHLAARLPEHMIPVAFVALGALPLTAHGKVDVEALPAPEPAAGKAVPEAELAASPSEKILAEIFREVLGLSAVGVHDRFFRIGGDSISSVQVVAKARQAGLDLSLQQIFQHQTIHALARVAFASASASAPTETSAFGLISAEDRARLPAGVEDAYPPAAVQIAMLFFSGLDASAHVYHSVSSHEVRARFDAEAFRQAGAAVSARHPILRSAFDLSRFSVPLLLVHAHIDPPIQVHDLRSLPAPERSRAFSAWLAAEQKTPFNWGEPPLFRLHLHRIDEDSFRITMSLHHALLDGWSLAVVVTELLEGYAARLRGEQARLPPLVSTYRDFIALEQAALSDASCQRHWDEILADAPIRDLPRWPASFRERDRGPGFLNVPLPASLTEGVLALAEAAGVPTKSVLLAVHAFVISRVMGQDEVLLGLTSHGRPEAAQAAELSGNFLNVLPLRAEVGGGTWVDLCRAVLEAEQRSLPFRRYPLAEMQKRAGRERLFETAFNFIHFRVAKRLTAMDEVDVLEIEDVAPGEMTLQANFAIDARTGRVNLQLTYDPSALCHAQVEAIAGYHRRALEAMIEAPTSRYEGFSVLSADERHKVLVGWNGPVTEVGERPFIHDQIAAQASARPDHTAVMSADPEVPVLSYRELDERSNRLAHHLRALSVGPGSVIGMHVERSPEMIMGLLAALKSGAAYLPIDPLLPADRVRVLLEQVSPDVVLHKGPRPDLPGVRRFVSLDREWATIAEHPATAPRTPISASDLAYVLFTSGSTGTPKGAQITQGNLAAFMDSARGAYGIRESDRVLQFATLSFDTSIEEIYLTLMQGGTLVLRDDTLVSSPERLIEGCQRLGLTALHFPTAYWHMLTAELVQKGLRFPKSVRIVFIGGEAALPQRVHAWHKHFGETPALVNTYGTTETTAVISIFTLGTWEERHREGLPFPVGRPLPTVQAYVVDRHMQPAPIGTPGELFIGGPQVGPGYWRLPEMSLERYTPNPLGPGRIYRSGDIVRWFPDGTMECCGRADVQVKIRGYRVEPGEVESILSGHPDVRGAGVIVREDRPGDRRLVAYATVRASGHGEGNGEAAISAATIRRYLQQKLPEYAVPSEVMLLDDLPVTPNGKLDRRALLALRTAPPSEETGDATRPAYAPPKNAIEERLERVFAEVLGRPRVGVDDNFFDLGGDSLVAMQISSRIHGAFEIDIPFRPILENPSVSALAAHIQSRSREGASRARLHLIPPEQRGGRLPVSYAQQRMWFLDRLGHGVAYNLASHIVLSGKLDVEALHRALQAIVDRHEVLRTTYESEGSDVYQVISSHATLALPFVDLGALKPEERAAEVLRLHAEEQQRPIDLGRDLMIRCQLLRLTPEDHRLFCTIHHIAADAWSLNRFNEDLAALYSAFAEGRPSPLAPLAAQYADFASSQRREDLGPTLAYWKEKLRAPLPVLDLPLDHTPKLVQDQRGGTTRGHIAAPLVKALKALGRQQEATLFMVLAAAFNLLLHRYTGAEDVVIGVPSVGRSSPETERMLGLFINTVVLRTDLSAPESGPLTFPALLRRVRATTLDAFAHQDAPFEKLVEELQPDRLPGRDPIFEVMLNLVSVPDTEAQPSGLTMTVLEEEDPAARRALTLYMKEQADGLLLTLTYQRALFEPERMACLLDQFTFLLEQAAEDPARTVHSFSLVTPKTRTLLPDLREVLPRPPQEPITRCFEAWAERAPGAPAVVWEGGAASYAELYRDAAHIARVLLAHGLTRGDVVAIHGARSYGVVASMFGALMSGGVMLTLDASLPDQRQQVMLDEAKTRFVLTVQGAEGTHSADHLAPRGRDILSVDAETARLAPGREIDGDRPLPVLSGDDPAYIMFTSGTTGKPKGILGVHRGVAHFLSWQRTSFGIGPGDRCAQLAGLSFEIILRDVFLAPTSGATLYLPPYRAELDAPLLVEWLEQRRITLLHPVPSLAAAWLEHAPAGFRGNSLRWSLFLGEPLPAALVQRWRQVFPESRVANFYGPSETTMAKCCYHVPAEPPPGIQPVGRPLPETQAFILDAHDKLCGIGELGQIVLRTPFRTLGYINDPEGQLRFVKNPERDDPEDWLYRSGDRGRYRPDGSLDILGRVDDQIKIRGVRIEPAEIKAVLDQHPRVSGSAVIASREGGEVRLVAYVTKRGSEPIDVKELRRYLGQRLHSAFVPSAIVQLAEIPVTSNGKVDRHALPPPPPAMGEAFAVPRTERERALVQIFQEVLGVHMVGIYDSFFEVGGHSLAGVHLMARIEQRFGQRLPLAALFESPTVEGLAARLDRVDISGWSPLVPIQPRGTKIPFFCAPGVGGNVLYLYQLARHLGPDQPFYGLQAKGLDGLTPPHTSIESMAADYIELVRAVQPEGPYLLGGHSFGGRVVFEMAQQLVAAGHEVPFVALFDCSPPFTLVDEGLAERDEVDMLDEMATILGFMSGRRVELALSALRAMPPEERLHAFSHHMEDAGVLPRGASPDQVRGWLSVFKSNYQMGFDYREREVTKVPLVYFHAAAHPPEYAALRVDPWRKIGPLEDIVVSGSHLTMMAEPHVKALAAALSERLARAARGRS